MPRQRWDLVSEWETSMIAQGLSYRTYSERATIVDRLAEGVGDPSLATARDVMGWIAANRHLWSPSTLATYDSYLRAWFDYLIAQGIRTDHPMGKARRPRVPKREPRPVTDEHVRVLLATRMHRRTRVMILLAAFAGLRVHEIAKIRGTDVDLIGGWIYVVGKGGKGASVPLHPLIADAAADMPREGYWFPTHVGNKTRGGRGSGADAGVPILPRSVSTLIGNAMMRAGISGGTAHRLRHWYGTSMVELGANMAEAQQALRHASIATTQLYVQVGQHRVRQAVFRLSADGDPGGSTSQAS